MNGLDTLNNLYRTQYGRGPDHGEPERAFIQCRPDQRGKIIDSFKSDLENPDLSIRERAELLSMKVRLTNTHLQMLKVYR